MKRSRAGSKSPGKPTRKTRRERNRGIITDDSMAARCGVPVLLHSQCSHEGGHALGSDRIGKFAACFEGGADDEAISDGQEVADVRQGHAAAKEKVCGWAG